MDKFIIKSEKMNLENHEMQNNTDLNCNDSKSPQNFPSNIDEDFHSAASFCEVEIKQEIDDINQQEDNNFEFQNSSVAELWTEYNQQWPTDKNLKSKAHKHKCLYCEKAFTTAHNLKKHTKSTHEERKENRCDFCIKSFDSAIYLSIHVRHFHLGWKSLPCDFCEKSFHLPCSLKNIFVKNMKV